MQSTEPTSPYAEYAPLDAVVLAGTDTNPRLLIRGENKAFLQIGGLPLVQRVVSALIEASTIGQVFVVGPSQRLRQVLSDVPGKVTIVASVPEGLIGRGLKAGDWVREAATRCGGGGGGRPDRAQAGGKDVAAVPGAIDAARAFAEEKLA